MPRSIRLALTVLLLFTAVLASSAAGTQLPPLGGAEAFRTDLAARRAKTMAALGPETVLILWSAPTRVYSLDVDYEYRQDSYLQYLTGIQQEETILVLVPGAKTAKEWVFTREPNPTREHWNGHTLRPAEVTAWSGIAHVQPLPMFQGFIDAVLGGSTSWPVPLPAPDEFAAVTAAAARGAARVAVLLEPQPRNAPEAPPAPGSRREYARVLQQRFGVTPVDARPLLNEQRQIKTGYEASVLRRSVEISAEAHIEGMKVTRPGRWEYEVEAAIEHWYLKNGALSWGYPSIVGSGPNATILHYNASTRQMQDGDLLLVDAAASFQGLTGDITRTWPVNGRFTPEQRAIYELVLRAQEAGIAAARAGNRTADITRACREVMAEGLLRLGLIANASQVATWATHGIVHGIGMDVHDPGNWQLPLAPGMAFVIEPGIYIREAALDALPKTPENEAFAAAVRPVVRKYRDIGVRIEDSFLLTERGLENLSVKTPKLVADLEKIVGTGR